MKQINKFIVVTINVFLLLSSFGQSSSARSLQSVSLMPWPQSIEVQDSHYMLPSSLKVFVSGMDEKRREFQVARLKKQLMRIGSFQDLEIMMVEQQAQSHIRIIVTGEPKAYRVPQLGDSEAYRLSVDNTGVLIASNSVFGVQHGISSLIQIVASQKDNHLPYLYIADQPRFPWRGLLIDSVRHFFSTDTIKRQIDGMAAAKLNVLHWHLTDDQGWRVQSKSFPNLTELASDGLYYSSQQVTEIVEYASLNGIRVVPEFGMPGHASAIAVAYPELMAEKKQYAMERHWGIFKSLLDVSSPNVYRFVDQLLAEMTTLFPDQYLHIGGDEVDPEQWLSNKKVQSLMTSHALTDGRDIQNYFNQQIQPILAKHNRIMVGWDEIFHPNLPQQVVIQSWRGHDSLNAAAKNGYQGLLSTGYYIDQPQYTDYHYRNDPLSSPAKVDSTLPIQSSYSFVIDRLKGNPVTGELVRMGNSDVRQYLIKLNNNTHLKANIEREFSIGETKFLQLGMDSWMGPLRFELNLTDLNGTVLIGNSRYSLVAKDLLSPNKIDLTQTLSGFESQKILGGEATIWSEMVTENNLDTRIWPRLFAIAERLWSSQTLKDPENMYRRLWTMSDFVANIVGIKHQRQMRDGFISLLNDQLDETQTQRSLRWLLGLSEMLEPAHYYTRHHIKHQQNAYHQHAPLNHFVDYLPVESPQIQEIQANVNAFQYGDEDALSRISAQLFKWQKLLMEAEEIISYNKKLMPLYQRVENLRQFHTYALGVIASCNDKSDHNAEQQQQILTQPFSWQVLTDELVIGSIEPMRQLYLSCQNK
ncbi:family 20 glycosylhydrolase [Pseudoalteromonas sp. T1lg65]|uniref:family 20 glycosylhydrolase n=1 Tax=Pseudoalteromonas sp. T1lg65 TaxID=2077101 RepID=UPI003F7B2B1D